MLERETPLIANCIQVLHPRLTARAYPESKIAENIECEIMEVVIEEARESYAKEVVVELRSETEQANPRCFHPHLVVLLAMIQAMPAACACHGRREECRL